MGFTLARAFEADIAVWLALTLILGGAGAMATGRALALAWRPAALLIPSTLSLAAVSSFLCWALFDAPVIPAGRLFGALLAGDWGEAGMALSGLGMSFLLLWAMGAAGFAMTRRRQMRRQYPFLAQGAVHLEKL